MLHKSQNFCSALILLVAIGLISSGVARGQENEAYDTKSGVPIPRLKTPEGKECVEPVDEIRKHHADYLLHQRDQTVYSGIRTKKYSLKNCVDCHADPVTKSVIGQDGFCESCHRYTAVTIDCFSCHTDKATDKNSLRSGIEGLGSKIIDDIGGVK